MPEGGASGGGGGGGGAGCALQQAASDCEQALSVLSTSEHARNPVRRRWSPPRLGERRAKTLIRRGRAARIWFYARVEAQ